MVRPCMIMTDTSLITVQTSRNRMELTFHGLVRHLRIHNRGASHAYDISLTGGDDSFCFCRIKNTRANKHRNCPGHPNFKGIRGVITVFHRGWRGNVSRPGIRTGVSRCYIDEINADPIHQVLDDFHRILHGQPIHGFFIGAHANSTIKSSPTASHTRSMTSMIKRMRFSKEPP